MIRSMQTLAICLCSMKSLASTLRCLHTFTHKLARCRPAAGEAFSSQNIHSLPYRTETTDDGRDDYARNLSCNVCINKIILTFCAEFSPIFSSV